VIFVCENNMYAMSVPWIKASHMPDVADRAVAYGIPGEVIDGMDVLAVRGAVIKATERARRGEGPTLIEAKTYRWFGHSHSDPRAYRTKEEEAEWKAHDPINVLRQNLQSIGLLSEAEADTIDQAVKTKLKQAMAFSEASPEPSSSELYTDLFSPSLFTHEDIKTESELRQRVRNDPDMRVISYAQALAEAMREEMKRDSRVFIFGEDVGLYGGAYGVTRDLWKEFGDLGVIDTLISEATIGGAAVGAAMARMRPVAEIMYVDFTPLVMDQIANQGAKNRYMFGGKTTVPMVIRTERGAGRAIAAHHS
jgi:2-oxoisovalerate dehydrogenase E1 component